MKQHTLLFLFLALLTLTGNIAFGQGATDCTPHESWIGVGGGLPGEGLLSTEMNGDLYMLHRIPGNPPLDSNRFGISRWNGSAWKPVTDFRTTDNGYATFNVLKSYNGALYLGGTFTSFNGNRAMGALVRWDGSTWSTVGGNADMTTVYALEVHNGELYASMEDWLVNGHILRWNGATWDDPGGTPAPVPHHGRITTLLSWNGALYAGGTVPSATTPPPIALKWDGSTWTSLGNNDYGFITQLLVYNDTLYAAGTELSTDRARGMGLIKWDGSSWQEVWAGSGRPHLDARATVHKGELYMIAQPEPTGPRTYYRNIDRFDGTAWHTVSNTNGTIAMIGEYRGDLVIAGDFSASCGGSLDNVAMLCDDQNCGRISGTVYYDFNSNCILDLDEKRLEGRIVRISPGDQYTVTDRDGKYSRNVLKGDYTVALTPYTYWDGLCPASPGTYQVTVSTPAGTSGNDFGTRPILGIQDLRVSVAAGHAHQGRQLTYAITYKNVGTVTMNGTVRFLG